ncbi:ATP-binding protein [Tundrisphaera lichenicola]|uniref:ATP-binding protein n=1 Tax=Tundrisphaera lichenicola TaxID=2029860 RepID=UPI003EBFCF11
MQGRRHTLLIVDDEPDVLDSLRHLFHRAYRVLTAEAGGPALEILKAEDVHVILSDQRMPGMTGDAFLAQARLVRPDAVRMLFTGYADIQAVINAVNEGRIFRYILKPWDPLELEALVRQAVEQYELVAERNRLVLQLQEANERLTRANQELEESGVLKSAFIEVASHEFNTPITLVLGLSELLRLLNPDREPREREVVERIAGSARQLAKLVANTLTLMRSEDFRNTLHPEPVSLESLLRDVVARVEPFVARRDHKLIVDIADDLGEFRLDAAKIGDAVLNLLTNAIKFTPDGGEIRLHARLTSPEEAEVIVADRGIGVEPRALRQMFQPFFTEFDPSRHSSGDFGFQKRGLGLGLSIVRQFVELHGGRVSAESELGRGTRITLRLPRHPFLPEKDGLEWIVPDVTPEHGSSES